ncbi:MAG: GAF domain-containing sensor histidine kinase [Chloroflexota bacterium]
MSKKTKNSFSDRYLSLLDISRELSSTLNLDALLHQIVTAAADLTDSMAASIMLYDETNDELYFHSSTNLDARVMRGLVVPVKGSIAGEILKERIPVVAMNVAKDPRHFEEVGKTTNYEVESLLGIPMITKEKVVGVLEVVNKKNGDFDKDDENLLIALGSQAAIAIENSRLFQQSDLIAEMVHEFRTPLGSIQTAAHLLTRPEISQKQRTSMAETIKKETNRLTEMATSFLDLARLESGRTQFSFEDCDLNAVLKESAELMESHIEAEGLTLKWQLTEPIKMIQADPDKIKQVVINLISNGIKYNRAEGSLVLGSADLGKQVNFFVQDSGRGMLPEHVEMLFGKFFRVPGSEKMAQGTGLGLSISKKIVESHGGQIQVESKIGEGTTFTVTLPKKQ